MFKDILLIFVHAVPSSCNVKCMLLVQWDSDYVLGNSKTGTDPSFDNYFLSKHWQGEILTRQFSGLFLVLLTFISQSLRSLYIVVLFKNVQKIIQVRAGRKEQMNGVITTVMPLPPLKALERKLKKQREKNPEEFRLR